MEQKNKSDLYQAFEAQFPKVQNYQLQDNIDFCTEFKINCYHRFLLAKKAFQEIRHRKIVQKICSKYIAQQKLLLDCQAIINNENRAKINNQEIFQQMGEILKQLRGLQNLEFNLFGNEFGFKKEDMKILLNILKLLPNTLQKFTLHLSYNRLYRFEDNMKYFRDAMKYLPPNLNYFFLNLSSNNLGQKEMNVKYLADSFKYFPKKLEHLEILLGLNKLGDKVENMRYFGEGMKKLPKSIKKLSLKLTTNWLPDNMENMVLLGQAIQSLDNIKHLELYIKSNGIKQKEIQIFREQCQVYLDRLEKLELNY